MVENNRVVKVSLGLPLWREPPFCFYQDGERWLRFFPKEELENATGGNTIGGRFMESFLEGVWAATGAVELKMFHGKRHEMVYDFSGGRKCQCNPPFFLIGLAFGLGCWTDVQKQLIDIPRPVRMGVFVNTAHWYLNNDHEGKVLLRNRNSQT